MTIEKLYLGDAVFASFDGYHLWLTTENGISTTNTIGLDPHVIDALFALITKIYSDTGNGATSMTSKEQLQNDLELAKGITELTRITDTAISILARAILELEDPEGHHHLPNNTRKALQALVSRFNDAD